MHAEFGARVTHACEQDMAEPGGGHMLLERDAELAALAEAVEAARGRACAVVVIQGPPGAGKSALLDAAKAYGRSAGVRVLSGGGGSWSAPSHSGWRWSCWPRRCWRRPMRSRPGCWPAWPPRPARCCLSWPGEPLAVADTSLLGLCWVAAHLAGWNLDARKSTPLLVTVDDVQWADAPSLRFLAMLADRASRLPLSMVVTVRDGEPVGGMAGLRGLIAHPRARLLVPAPLTASAVRRPTEAAFPGAEPALSDAVAHASGGNPFFVSEVLRLLRDEDGTPAAGTVADLVPETVLRSVLTRLDRLPDDAGRLAASLAVLGDGTPLRRVAAHAGLELEAAERVADLLARAQLLRPEPRWRSPTRSSVPPCTRTCPGSRGPGRISGRPTCWPPRARTRTRWPGICWPPSRKETPAASTCWPRRPATRCAEAIPRPRPGCCGARWPSRRRPDAGPGC